MIELITLYCVFMYLLTIGIAYQGIQDGLHEGDYVGLVFCLLLSPLLTPVLIGMLIVGGRR